MGGWTIRRLARRCLLPDALPVGEVKVRGEGVVKSLAVSMRDRPYWFTRKMWELNTESHSAHC